MTKKNYILLMTCFVFALIVCVIGFLLYQK